MRVRGRLGRGLAVALLLLSGGCSGGEEPAAKATPKAPAPAPAPAPLPPPPPPPEPENPAPAPKPEPAPAAPPAPSEPPSPKRIGATPLPLPNPVPEPPKPEVPQADPAKEFQEALAAGRFDEASRLLERMTADPARIEMLRGHLERVRTDRMLRASFDAGRKAALDRVAAAREEIARELKEESEREGRIAKALRELTDRAPLRIQLPGNVWLENVRVTAYAAGRVKLTWPQGEVEYPLELLPEETRAALLGGALAKATPRDHLEIGKLLLASKDYDRAARCFATAAQRDPALAPACPDIARIRQAARVFEGSFKAAGNTLGIRWTFSGANEAKDFVALEGKVSVRPGAGLEVDGPKLALAAAREIPFRDRVRASALARESGSTAHVLGLKFVKPSGGEVLIYGALATSLKAFIVFRVEDGRSERLLEPTPGAPGNRMTMDFNPGRFTFKVGEKTVWSGNEGGFTDVAVIVGGTSMAAPGKPDRAVALFREITLSGGVNPAWMAKKMGAYREVFLAELSRENQVNADANRPETLALSIDLLVARAAPAARTAYASALEKLRAYRRSSEPADRAAAEKAMEQVTAAEPSFAPAWHFRGALAEEAGDSRAASEHYGRALGLLPEFPEALCARATLQALDGKWDDARRDVERAFELKPDLGEAHLLRARLEFEAGEASKALESARTARKLSPLDPRLQARAQMLANVIRGPGWARPNSAETPHYAVRSDLPAARCRAYAEHLEAVRSVYEEVLGRLAPAGKRATVLIFDAEEGYYTYMDFTAGDRQEHTLGVFSPWHGQMVLFEDADAEETLRVLSHEGFHQYLHALMPDVPIWFNEGMAEYVGATRVEKGKAVERGGIQAGRLNDLKAAFKYGWPPVPFEKIMTESQPEFYSKFAPFRYAQAWSMIHFFIHGEGGRWKGLLREYVDRLAAGDGAREAFAATFGKHDLAPVEAAWLKHHGLTRPAVALIVEGAAAPAPAAAPPPAPAASNVPEGATDMLALLQARGPRVGEWVFRDGALVSFNPRGGWPSDLTVEPPEEYDWHLRVERLHRIGGSLVLGLVAASRQFVIEVDGGQLGLGGTTSLETLDGRSGAPNETAVRKPCLIPGRNVSIDVSVRKTGIKLVIDGTIFIDWKGHYSRLSLPTNMMKPTNPRTVFIFSKDAMHSITEMWLKPLKPAGPEAEPPGPPPLTMKEIKERLASKSEAERIQAVTALGILHDREARTLLGQKLVSDTEPVRRAATQAIVNHKHPQAAEALGKAIQAQPKSTALVDEFIRALGALDQCASLPVLVWALEIEDGKHSGQALGEIRRIGCVCVARVMADFLKRAEAERKKPDMVSPTRANPNKNRTLLILSPRVAQALGELAGVGPRGGETWWQFVARGGVARRLVSIHYCSAAKDTFEVSPGKSAKCPNPEAAKTPHEDPFLKHRPE